MTLDPRAVPRCIQGAQERSAQSVDDQSIGKNCRCTRGQGVWGREG